MAVNIRRLAIKVGKSKSDAWVYAEDFLLRVQATATLLEERLREMGEIPLDSFLLPENSDSVQKDIALRAEPKKNKSREGTEWIEDHKTVYESHNIALGIFDDPSPQTHPHVNSVG